MIQSLRLNRCMCQGVAIVVALIGSLVIPEASAQQRGQRAAATSISEAEVKLYEPHTFDEMPYQLKLVAGGDNGKVQLSSDRCDPEPDFMKWLFKQKLSDRKPQSDPKPVTAFFERTLSE